MALIDFIVAAISRVLAKITRAWLPSITRWLVKLAVTHLPEFCRERFQEEWQAHIDEISGPVKQLFVATSLSVAAIDIALDHRCNQVLEGWNIAINKYDRAFAFSGEIQHLLQNSKRALSLAKEEPVLSPFIEDMEMSAQNLQLSLRKHRNYRSVMTKVVATAAKRRTSIPAAVFVLFDAFLPKIDCDLVSHEAEKVQIAMAKARWLLKVRIGILDELLNVNQEPQN